MDAVPTFTPDLPERHWAEIRAFVFTVVATAGPRTPYSERELLGVVTRHVHFVWQTLGLELDLQRAFDPQIIEVFIRRGCPPAWSAATRGNARSMLLRTSEAVRGAGLRRVPLPPANPARPYSSQELERLRAWAAGQRTAARRRDAGVLLALGAGGGIPSEDVVVLRVRDVVRTPNGIDAWIGGRRPRCVPLLRSWEYLIEPSLTTLDADRFIFRPNRTIDSHKNAVTNFVKACATPPVALSSQRLRATWIVHHLAARTPLKTLMAAAGMETVSGLSRYLRFVPDTDAQLADRFLRGDA